MKRPLLSLKILLIAALLLSAGCDEYWQDKTHDLAFGNFGAVIGTWKTKVPLLLVEGGGNLHRHDELGSNMILVLSDAGIGPNEKDLGVLPIGTEVRIEHLYFLDSPATCSLIATTGSLTAGPYKDRPLELNGLLFAKDLWATAEFGHGDAMMDNRAWEVNSDVLEK